MSTIYKKNYSDDLFGNASFGGGGGGGGGGNAAARRRANEARERQRQAQIAKEKKEREAKYANDKCGSSTNGTEWVPDKVLGVDVSKPCKDHDQNYMDGMNKLNADITLGKDVHQKVVDGSVPSLTSTKLAAAAGAIYAAGVIIGGQGAYDTAQKGQ